MIRKLIAIALFIVPSVSFAGDISTLNERPSTPATSTLVQNASATPFSLASKYWIRACARSDSSYGRAVWVLDTAYAAGEISEEQYESTAFLDAVEGMLFTFCD